MDEISLSVLLKAFFLQDPSQDPFKDGFDADSFIKSFKTFVDENYKDNPNCKDSGELLAIVQLNEIYESIMHEIETLLDTLNLNTLEIIGHLLALSNFEAISISHIAATHLQKDTKNIPSDFKDFFDVTLKNIYGDDIKVQDASDMNIEICNVLIKIIWDYNPKPDIALPKSSDEEAFRTIRHCMLFANLLFNVKDAFHYFKYEFGIIESEEKKITFRHIPHLYFLLRNAGKERMDNLTQEHAFYFMNQVNTTTKASQHSVSNGKLTFRLKGTEDKNTNRVLSAGLQATHYFYLKDVRMKSLDNITIHDLLSFISELQFLFQYVNHPDTIESAADYQDVSCIPFYINKKELIHHLHKLTGLKEKTVSKLISHLTTAFDKTVDLWKTPFIGNGANYYFKINCLSHLNTAYAADQIIKSVLNKQKQSDLFQEYLLNHVMINKQLKKMLPHISLTEGADPAPIFNNSLAFELDTLYILLQPCIILFPFNSLEYAAALDEISTSAFILEDKRKAFQESLKEGEQKRIISIVATNYPSLSGLVVNDCYVLDHYLLLNYFSTGAFKRGMVIMGGENTETKKLSSYAYYSNGREMSENFPDFCLQPDPIKQIIVQYDLREYPISFRGSLPEIFRDGVQKAPFADTVWKYVKEIEYCLRQLFYFEKSLKKDPVTEKEIEKRIDFLLPQVLGSIAFQKEDQHARLEVLDIFKKVRLRGLSYLINSFRNSIAKLSGKQFKKTPASKNHLVNVSKAQADLNALLTGNLQDDIQISLSSLKLNHTFAREEIINILEYLVDVLSSLQQRKYNEDELNDTLLLMIIFTALSREEKIYERFLYPIFLNFIDALNFNFQYQKAKNFAEEVLTYSFSNQHLPLLGWLCLYKCFLKQKSIYDAAYYGVLFVSCIEISPDIDEELLTHVLYNSMLFFRDYQFTEVTEALYELLKGLELSEYDQQKITLSHFSSHLVSRELDNVEEDLMKIKEYLDRHLASICSYHERGTVPWLAFLYNFRNLKKRGYINSDIDFIEDAVVELEKEINPEELKRMQAQIFPIPVLSKEILKEALIKVFESIDFEDAAFELENLEPLARNVASLSLQPLDIDGLLLTGLVLNDQRLTFPQNKYAGDKAPFISEPDEVLLKKMQSYQDYVIPKLKLSPGQILIWLFSIFEKVYCLQVDARLQFQVSEIPGWSLLQMDSWLQKISGFNFDDKGGSYSINEQEQDYLELIRRLPFAVLSIDDMVSEVLLYTSLSLSVFPHNLIQTHVNKIDKILEIHSDAMKESIMDQGTDFLSLCKPVSNVISLEWFLENQAAINLHPEQFTIESWIPIVDEDYALLIGHSKLVPLLEEKYGFPITTDLVPDKPFHSSINIFMAHGSKGFEGFKTIYTRNEEGHAIVKEFGIEKLFGNGIIAIVFVCHSASISAEAFAQKLVSFSHQILSLGYKAVIAPAWALNPIIVPIWLEEFLEALHNGEKINKCVLRANRKVAMTGFNEYHGFYAPSGWAAMHLYGNPNISFRPYNLI